MGSHTDEQSTYTPRSLTPHLVNCSQCASSDETIDRRVEPWGSGCLLDSQTCETAIIGTTLQASPPELA